MSDCDGRCVYASDLIGGVSPDLVAIPDPGCSMHGVEGPGDPVRNLAAQETECEALLAEHERTGR